MTIWYAQWYSDALNTPEFQTPQPALGYNDVTQSFTQNGVSQIVTSLSWAGGSTSHAFTVPGITTDSIVETTIMASANASYIVRAVVTTNTLTVTFNTDPGAVTIGLIAYSGQINGVSLMAQNLTWAGGSASNAFAVDGITTDSIVSTTIIASENASYIVKSVPTTDTLTITFNVDPGAVTVSLIAYSGEV